MSDNAINSQQLTKLLIRLQAGCALGLLLLLGGLDFFFPSQYALKAAVHGMTAISSVVVGTYMTHRAYFLLRGAHINYRSLCNWSLASTLINLLAAISGNWIYMPYRGEQGPRDWILKNVPDFHNVLMEFKEFVSLFPFPLMVIATFGIFYYKNVLQSRHDIKQYIGIVIFAAWFFLMLGFVAGLTLAKLRLV